MVGFYDQSYGHGAARIPMPGILDIKKHIGRSDDLSFWELIKLGELGEAFQRLYERIFPQFMMMILTGLLLFIMILISMTIHSVFGREAKPKPVVVYPKVWVAEKKEPMPKPEPKPELKPEPKPVPQQPKIERKKQIVPKKKPPVKPQPKIVRKTPLYAKTTPVAEKNPVPDVQRTALQRTDSHQASTAPTPVRSTSFRPVQSTSTGSIERDRRSDVELYDPNAKEEAHISPAGVRSKREGINVSQSYSETGPRSALDVGSRGTSQAGEIEITGVSLASLEACPNSLEEVEFKKQILKVIGGRKTCSNATGEYIFYKTGTIASFNMIVKPKGGRRLRNRCDELNNAYQCILTSGE